jgi:hypothetical protein
MINIKLRFSDVSNLGRVLMERSSTGIGLNLVKTCGEK